MQIETRLAFFRLDQGSRPFQDVEAQSLSIEL